ncbi:MAG TPA: hypothetical protein DIV86_01915 [Alphaproteobacteria bacterium]|nr:hypothetical protein [Alphaproteobacteria bacterium]
MILGANILTGLLGNAAINAASSLIGSITSSIEGTGQPALISQNFSDALNSTLDTSIETSPDISVLGNVVQPVMGTLQNQINNFTNSGDNISIGNTLTGSITTTSAGIEKTNIVDPSTLSEIDRILSDKPVVLNAETPIAVINTSSISNPANSNTPVENSAEGILQASSNKPLTPVGDAAKYLPVQTEKQLVQPLYNEKKDPRILGQDNLKAITETASRDMVKDFSKVTEKGIFAENIVDKGLDIKKNSESIISNSDVSLSGYKKELSENAYKVQPLKPASLPANDGLQYKIAHISKGKDSFEVSLEPENLGKLQIKIGFDAHGKASMMIVAERQDTLDMLKKDVAGFEKILGDNGIKSDAGSMSFNLKEQNQQQQQQQWAFFEKPVAFNLADLINQEEVNNTGRVVSAYNNNYSNSLVNILV